MQKKTKAQHETCFEYPDRGYGEVEGNSVLRLGERQVGILLQELTIQRIIILGDGCIDSKMTNNYLL